MAEFEYQSNDLRQIASKYVPIDGVNTTFMYGYCGPHDPIQQASCEKQIDQDIKARNG